MKKHLFLVALMLLMVWQASVAMPAYPFVQEILQSDGTTIRIIQKGDEFHHYVVTEDGVLVIRNVDGIYEYATLEQNQIRSTGQKAYDISERSESDKLLLMTLNNDMRTLEPNVNMLKQQRAEQTNSPKKMKGVMRSLVILVNFSNVSFTVNNPNAAFTAMLNEQGYSANGGRGSAKDYYIAASDSQFVPTFDVYGPYTLSDTRAYYGGNNYSGDDSNPQQMILDACHLASADVNFADYDYDNDGYVDNIFVYYAGHNEAEGGPNESVWPHRWVVPYWEAPTYNGKRLYDYACTSELRGNSGTNMCGIGTFVHEFGHVLGLPDFYITDYGSSHKTLDEWSVMDYGGYLNNGRTPCTYSAYERFYLDWLTPTILDVPTTELLEPLLDSNEAFIITQSGTHNFDGANPNPTEFFILENRQKSGWDQYLPGHGLLITRVNYSASDWSNNTVNNNANRMGVDLMEANNNSNSSSARDPFPGSSNITSYTPVLRSGTTLTTMPLSNINEVGRDITFDFMGGATSFLRYSGVLNDFVLQSTSVEVSQNVNITGNGLTDSVSFYFLYGNHFDVLNNQNQWVKQMTLPVVNGAIREQVEIRYSPQNSGSHSDRLYITSPDVSAIYIDVHGQFKAPNIHADSIEDMAVMVMTLAESWHLTSTLEEEYVVTIYNIAGQQLLQQHFSRDIEIYKSEYENGFYLFDISNADNTYRQIFKVIK